MSPAKRSTKPKARPARPAKPGKGAKGKAPKARPGAASRPAAAKERTHCAATDPFGDPCQSTPRLPSRYCTIHSYLDR